MKLDTPESFRNQIPRTLKANIQFRIELHNKLQADPGMQKAFLELVAQLPHIAFDCMFFIYNPRAKSGYRNIPFILRPHQDPVITALHRGYRDRRDVTIDKSRDEGATELICKYFALMARLEDQTRGIVGSRVADLVDKGVQFTGNVLSGSHRCLMHKILYTYATAPYWFRPRVQKTYMHIELLDNGSVIDGESTNENFAAGDRATMLMVDEIGRVEHAIADSIIGTVSDVCDFNVFNSTHWYGPEHPYNSLLTSSSSDIVVLAWEDNPVKNPGLYRSPEYGIVEIKDLDYYKKLCPAIFNFVKPIFSLAELRKNLESTRPDLVHTLDSLEFVTDGGEFNEGGWRSPWYDKECKRRRYNKRDIARNLDRNPMGSSNNFFSTIYLRRARTQTVFPSKYRGVFRFEKDPTERVKKSWFEDGIDSGPMKVFVPLINGRLDQSHNYILSCDISRGIGSSNSVCQIVDRNTCEQVAVYANPNLPPESFGDMVAALYHWVGGLNNPFLIWEANGPGLIFAKRILFHGIRNVYIRKDEEARTKKRKNQYGWWSTRGENGTKYVLLENLDIAIAQGIRGTKKHQHIIIHDVETIIELETYIQFPNGTLGPSELIEDSMGAQATHGDRVISLGLAVLALKYQSAPEVIVEKHNPPKNSLGARMERKQADDQKKRLNKRFSFLEEIWGK